MPKTGEERKRRQYEAQEPHSDIKYHFEMRCACEVVLPVCILRGGDPNAKLTYFTLPSVLHVKLMLWY